MKSLLVGGSAAAKIAATVAVVSATTVAAASPVQEHHAHHQPTGTGTSAVRTRSAAVVQPVPSLVPAPAVHLVRPARAVARTHHAAVASTVRVAHAHVAHAQTTAPPAPPVTAPAVPATPAKATVGNGATAPKASRTHGKSSDAHGKGAKRNVVEPQSLGTPASESGHGSKTGHASHGQQGGSNAAAGPVSTEPVAPAVASVDAHQRSLSKR
jgi:hypothetical protein